MDSEKFLDKIPDIYFDWYARLLPGGVAIAIYFYLENKMPDSSSVTSLFISTAIAYLAGHIVQPLSSFCVAYIQKLFSGTEDEAIYANAKRNTVLAGLTSKISKAHAEAVGMLSTFFLVVLIAFHQWNWELCNWEPSILILIIYLLLASIERSYARQRKITDLRDKVSQ